MVCFRATDELRRKLNMLTAAQNTSIQQVMLSLAEDWVEKMERQMERRALRRTVRQEGSRATAAAR